MKNMSTIAYLVLDKQDLAEKNSEINSKLEEVIVEKNNLIKEKLNWAFENASLKLKEEHIDCIKANKDLAAENERLMKELNLFKKKRNADVSTVD